MAALANTQTLLSLNTGVDPATSQTRLVALSGIADNTPEDLVFNVGLYLFQSGGATSPACSLTLQGSADGSTWLPLVQIRTSGSDAEEFAWQEVNLPSRLRIKMEPTGGTAPAIEARVMLAGSSGFTATITTP